MEENRFIKSEEYHPEREATDEERNAFCLVNSVRFQLRQSGEAEELERALGVLTHFMFYRVAMNFGERYELSPEQLDMLARKCLDAAARQASHSGQALQCSQPEG